MYLDCFVLTQINRDNMCKREVLALTVRCSNKAEGCDWSGFLRDLEVGHQAFSKLELLDVSVYRIMRNLVLSMRSSALKRDATVVSLYKTLNIIKRPTVNSEQ